MIRCRWIPTESPDSASRRPRVPAAACGVPRAAPEQQESWASPWHGEPLGRISYGGFHRCWHPHSWMVDFMENTTYKWMMTSSSPILWNLHTGIVEDLNNLWISTKYLQNLISNRNQNICNRFGSLNVVDTDELKPRTYQMSSWIPVLFQNSRFYIQWFNGGTKILRSIQIAH